MKALAFLVSFGLLAPHGKVINFDTSIVGKTPPGWSVSMTDSGAAPRWEIIKDRTAPSQPYVLAQMSSDGAHPHAPLAIFDGANLRDGDVSVRLKAVSGRAGQAGGVVFRYRDPNNYYVARANALENNVVLFKVQNGHRVLLASSPKHPIPANAWVILKVSVRGDKFQVFLDHRRIVEAQDKTFASAGKVGLWTLDDSVTYFDDFRVDPK